MAALQARTMEQCHRIEVLPEPLAAERQQKMVNRINQNGEMAVPVTESRRRVARLQKRWFLANFGTDPYPKISI
jgi:hypothetical protein